MTNAEGGCGTRFVLSSRRGNALPWLGVVGDNQLGLQEPPWLECDSGHVPDLPVLPGYPFPPAASCTLPEAPQLRMTPLTVMGDLQELPHGFQCLPGPAKH